MPRKRIPLGFLGLAAFLVLAASEIGPETSSPVQNSAGQQAVKPSIGDVLLKVILEQDAAAAIGKYRRLKAGSPDTYDFAEGRLNELGLDLIDQNRIKDAIEIFKLAELPFFNFYLKDKGTLDLPEAWVFETGSNRWMSYDRWPPRNTQEKKIYLRAAGKLSFEKPTELESDGAEDSFTSDPRKPVPWSQEIRTTQGHLWMVEDQRFAARRPDVLVYQSDVLTEEVTIAGPIIADLFVSTTGTDAD